MSKKQVSEIKPLISVVVIVATLFSVVFLKMEIRRLGYSIFKSVNIYRSLQDNYRLKVIDYAKFTSPDFLRKAAVTQLTMSEAGQGQIIHMSGDRIALKQ